MATMMNRTAPARAAAARVLVIDDEPDLLELLRHSFADNGYDVRTAQTGAAGLHEFDIFSPDVVVLDLMLPDVSGIDVCRRMRAGARGWRLAVLILSARGDEIDRVVAFEVGADDYVVKPFSMRELICRVRARLQTPGLPLDGDVPARSDDRRPDTLGVGPMAIDLASHRVTVNGGEIPVTPIEMRLLAYFVQSKGRVCSRQDLLTHVWYYEPDTPSRTVDTYIKRLREKLGVAGQLIQTVRGIGYRLADPYEGPDDL